MSLTKSGGSSGFFEARTSPELSMVLSDPRERKCQQSKIKEEMEKLSLDELKEMYTEMIKSVPQSIWDTDYPEKIPEDFMSKSNEFLRKTNIFQLRLAILFILEFFLEIFQIRVCPQISPEIILLWTKDSSISKMFIYMSIDRPTDSFDQSHAWYNIK
jgi:hypothetical protein